MDVPLQKMFHEINVNLHGDISGELTYSAIKIIYNPCKDQLFILFG